MAKYSSKDVAFLLVNGRSILGVQTEIRHSKEVALEDTLVLGSAAQTWESTGVKRATFEQSGFYDDASGGNNEVLVAGATTGPGSERVLCFGVAGNGNGRGFIGFKGAVQGNYERVMERGALHKANGRFVGSGDVEDGIILHALGTENATTGNTQATSHDNAVSTPNGAVLYAQVTALTLGGYTSFEVVLRHSADNITYANLAGSAVFTAIGGSRILTSVVTVNRYTAAQWTFNGAGSGQSATFMAGIVRR